MRRSGLYADLVADLQKWLRQNDTPAGAWYWDEDAGTTPPAKPVPPAVESAVSASAVAEDDPFTAECSEFVARAMDTIARRRQEGGVVSGLLDTAPVEDPAGALAAMRSEVLTCTACELHQRRHHVVFGAGSPTAELVIVGEAPGRDEDLQGEPFVGRSGQLLTKILAAIGLARDEVFICNILKCRPPENRDPLPPEVAACEPHLRCQLALIRPRVICCLGRVAAQTLLKTTTSLGRLRGGVHFYQDIPVLATYHPAYLLRNPAAKRDAWNDVRKLRALLDALK